MSRLTLPLGDETFLDLMRAWGVPYSYGAGAPADGHASWPDGSPGIAGGIGWDCSGFAQACLVRMGMLSERAPDRTAAALYDLCQPVPVGSEHMGDLAFYGVGRVSHVTVVVAPGVVLGACGGTSKTNSDDPNAYVKLARLDYRPDLVGVRRFAVNGVA